MTLTFEDLVSMTKQERDELSDEQVLAMAYGIAQYEPWDKSLGPLDLQWEVRREMNERLQPLQEAELEARKVARAAQLAKRELVRCDCGHTVPANQRMSASMGSSCPDCYDRMSDGC